MGKIKKFKTALKCILPPLLFYFLRSMYKVFSKRRYLARWHIVSGGILEGCSLYTNDRYEICREMIMGNYDIFCWDYLQKVDLSSKTVIDVGAHVGYYSMCFSRLVGKYGKVYAFEPNTANVERMQINLKKNKQIITNIWVEPLAISSYVGKSKFCFSTDVDGQNSRGGYLKGSHKPLSQKVYEKAKFTSKEIDVTTIDSFVKGNDIKNIELIKVDVEGAEHFVVQGAKETLSNFSPILLIEVHSVVAMLELIRELVNLNYGVNLLKDDSSSRCFISAEKHKL